MPLSNNDLKEMLGLKKPRERKIIDVREQNTKLFSNISIETGAKCNRACAFCPQAYDPRDEEWMPDEVFSKCIDDLVALNYKQRITLNSYNEPVRDKRLPDFIREIRRKLPRTWILINSNGDYFKTADDIKKLFDAGLNAMQINIYNSTDGSGNPKAIASGIENSKKRYAFMKGLVDSMPELDQDGSIYHHGGARGKVCQVMTKWDFQPEDVADHHGDVPTKKHGISVRHHISNRAGSIPNFVGAMAQPMEKMCVRPFRAFMVNWRGDAYLCCNDYYGDTVVGNVMEKSILELFNDDRYNNYRIKLQNKNRDIFLCDKCDYGGGFYSHNVQHITKGDEEDLKIIIADMKSQEAAGFGHLVRIRKKE